MPGAVRARCQGSLVKPASLRGHHYKLLHTCREGSTSYHNLCVCVCVCVCALVCVRALPRVHVWLKISAAASRDAHFRNFMTSPPILFQSFHILMALNKQIIAENCFLRGVSKYYFAAAQKIPLTSQFWLLKRISKRLQISPGAAAE